MNEPEADNKYTLDSDYTLTFSAIKESIDKFDRSILTLSSSGLGLSFLLLNSINFGKNKFFDIWLTFILILSWVALLTSIVSTISSFRTSSKAFGARLHGIANGTLKMLHLEKKYDRKTNLYNNISYIAFLLGIFLLSIFSISTVINKTIGGDYPVDKKQEIKKSEKGLTLPPRIPNPNTSNDKK